MTVRLLLADDQNLIRAALASLLETVEDFEVVATVARGDEVVNAAISHTPDVALLDVQMPGLDGLTAAAALHARMPECKIVILTTFGREGYLHRAIEAGAVGFIVKDAPAEVLSATVRKVMAGEIVIDPVLAASTLWTGKSPLTARERDVLLAARTAATVSEIASILCLSEGTVRNYLSYAIAKTQARNRTEAARIAEEKGWL